MRATREEGRLVVRLDPFIDCGTYPFEKGVVAHMAKSIRRTRSRRLARKLVAEGDIDGLLRWARDEPNAAKMLVTRVCDLDATRRWSATVALGRIARQMADDGKTEDVRNVVRRLLWNMNDESGGIAWHGPEAIAEILANVPELLGEYGRIVASFIDQSPFGPGVHWAVARLAAMGPDQFVHVVPDLVVSLDSEDPWLRGYALEALAVLKPGLARERARTLLDDGSSIARFDSETAVVSTTSLSHIARGIVDVESRGSGRRVHHSRPKAQVELSPF